jgi:soluble lytic murein transglycosylase
LLTASSNNYEQARGAFWAARLARSHQQNQEEASALFEMAHDAAPNSYYGYRAAEELGISLTGSVPLGASLTDEDWQTSAAWVLEWAQTDTTDAQAVLADVERSGFVQRAVELREVGLDTEAIGEWNSGRDAWADEPLRLAALAWQAHHHNMPYIGLKASEQLVVLAPSEALPPPEPIERLMFPAPYSELVVQETRAHDVDPRLFYALLRQESLFNPGATSWVGARGLAQVMPSTGQGIAQNLGVADFQLDDLYRPQVSIEFGAFYLGQRLQDMEGSPHGALAAYNGGLGNAQRWASGSHVADADLFTEYIDYPETETYVKRVYGYYGVYQRLYTLPEDSS